eukprot:TRINITY_DN370_c0_g1_i1.p1 TRINITY_DN370_c0_g1~~TRINITY_DN370_c0_g1_i1.p1  ORF type:complete len:612 (+),score=66.61 TRINITY_DN370_c0_g1_i1:13-1848(+)
MYPYGFGAQPAPQVGAQPEVRERKRKWDVPGVQEQPPAPPPGLQPELALQNAATRLNQMLANRGMSTVHAFEKKVDVNNCKPETRYYLCRGTTHEEIGRATQAALRVRGRYKDPHDTSADEALHLFVTAPTQVQLDQAIRMIDDIIKRDQVRGPGAQAGNFQGKCVVGLENAEPVFGLHGRILGPKGAYLKHIQSTANCKVTLKGRGSGFFEQNTGQEAPEPLYLHVQAGTKADFEQAKQLTEDLLSTIRSDYYSQFGGMPRGPTPPGPQQGFAAPPAPQPFRQPYATPIAPPGPPAPGPAAFPPPAYPPAPYGAAVPPPPPGYPYPYPPPSYPPYGYPPGYPPAPIPPPGPPGYAPPPQYPPYPPQPVQQPVAQPPQHPPPQQLQQPPQQLQPQPPVPRRFQERVAEVEPAVPVPRRFQEAPQQRTLWGDSAEEEVACYLVRTCRRGSQPGGHFLTQIPLALTRVVGFYYLRTSDMRLREPIASTIGIPPTQLAVLDCSWNGAFANCTFVTPGPTRGHHVNNRILVNGAFANCTPATTGPNPASRQQPNSCVDTELSSSNALLSIHHRPHFKQLPVPAFSLTRITVPSIVDVVASVDVRLLRVVCCVVAS